MSPPKPKQSDPWQDEDETRAESASTIGWIAGKSQVILEWKGEDNGRIAFHRFDDIVQLFAALDCARRRASRPEWNFLSRPEWPLIIVRGAVKKGKILIRAEGAFGMHGFVASFDGADLDELERALIGAGTDARDSTNA